MDAVAVDILLSLLLLGLAIPVATMAKDNRSRHVAIGSDLTGFHSNRVADCIFDPWKKRPEKKKRQSLRSRPTSKRRQPRGGAKVGNRKAVA